MSGEILGCHNWRGMECLAFSGEKPEMLLSTPHCTGQPPTTKIYSGGEMLTWRGYS